MAHHRATFARTAAALMRSTGRGASRKTQLLARSEAPLTLRPLDDAHGSGSVRAQIQARLVVGYATFAGRPIPKWTRYGCWNETGEVCMITRIL